jgi:hypothetical protein
MGPEDYGLAVGPGVPGQPQAGPAPDAGNGAASHLPAAQHQQAGAGPPGVPLLAERPRDQSGKPGLERRNGLITNDKFCLSRSAHLKLSWSRYEIYLRRKAGGVANYLREERVYHGGENETPMAGSPPDSPIYRRSTTLGSSIPELAPMVTGTPDGILHHAGADQPGDAGGER